MIKTALITLLIIFIALQFVRPVRNNGSAAGSNDITHYVPVPDTVMNILKNSCYDCHSNQTRYPWYVNINPVGLWLRSHINEGKKALNFSDLSGYNNPKIKHKLEEVAKEVEKHKMPLSSYTLIHTKARLNEAQIKFIMNWADSAKNHIGYKK